MDYARIAFSAVGVAFVMYCAGFVISILSTYLQCQKFSIMTSIYQGLIFTGIPTIVYLIAVVFIVIRRPFANTLKNFGVSENMAEVVAVGYLVMLSAWINAVYNIHNSEKAVCQTDAKEMTDFKKKLMSELSEKERQKTADKT
jgi:hypothetical protein